MGTIISPQRGTEKNGNNLFFIGCPLILFSGYTSDSIFRVFGLITYDSLLLYFLYMSSSICVAFYLNFFVQLSLITLRISYGNINAEYSHEGHLKVMHTF